MLKSKLLLIWLTIVCLLIGLIYSLANLSMVSTGKTSKQGAVALTINFLVPMRQESLAGRISVFAELPSTPITYQVKWLNPFSVKLLLAPKGLPQGQLLTFQIKDAPTAIPWFKKSITGKVRPQVLLKALTKDVLENIPSRGPVPIKFNAPVNPEKIKENVTLPVSGRLIPNSFSIGGRRYVDYSHWLFYPAKPFKNNKKYRIKLSSGIKSIGGSVLAQNRQISFTTAKKPKIITTKPAGNAREVQLYQKIEFTLDQEIAGAFAHLSSLNEETNIPGETLVKGSKVIFNPAKALLPGKTYKTSLVAESQTHEPVTFEFTFTTIDLGKKIWVEVNLGEIHMMTVYRGSNKVRQMLASGGRPESPTPTGAFYTQDRGHSFFSPRFGEGATYWVRLVGQILVHSVPRDSRWKVIEEEHGKLGLPASHGCVRLQERDAKWFFENIPMGTLVIIFDSNGGVGNKQSVWVPDGREYFGSSAKRKND